MIDTEAEERGTPMAWSSILDRLEADAEARSFKLFLEPGLHGVAQQFDSPELVRLAALAGEQLWSAGIRPGDRVVTILPTGGPLIQAILGTWAAGAIISVLAPTIESGRSSLSLNRLGRMLRTITPKLVVTDRVTRDLIAPLASEIACEVLLADELPTQGEAKRACVKNQPEDIAFVQFTSGSTGDPKAIVIEHGQLLTNVEETARRLDFSKKSVMTTWLPLYHDLGFVIAVMMPIASASTLILFPTETFIRSPMSWMKAITRHRGTHSPAPPFGCQVLTRGNHLRRAENLDLSSLTYLGLGGEPVPWKIIQEFEEAYAAFGLRPGTVRAAFGMAEATLSVSVSSPDGARRLVWIDKDLFRSNGTVRICPPRERNTMPLLSNGPPISGMEIKITDTDGTDLGEGRHGRIMISGPCVTKRYFGSQEKTQIDGWLDTGDLGFLLYGELFIAGRSKDVIIRGGVNINAHEVEEAVLAAFADRVTRAVVFSLPRENDPRDEVVIGVEMKNLPAVHSFQMEVVQVVARDVGLQVDHVVPLPKGAIPRTTSGKLQRGQARQLYRAGGLVPEQNAS